jgi:hypothetical protein
LLALLLKNCVHGASAYYVYIAYMLLIAIHDYLFLLFYYVKYLFIIL